MRRLYIVMYHFTRDFAHSRYPGIKGLDTELFREQIRFFDAGFNVITMEQLMEAVKSGTSLPDKAVLLTFDDGYIDNYTVAMPILEEYGMQGSFFIPGGILTQRKLLDVNKIRLVLASASDERIIASLKERMDHYRGAEFDYPSNDELYEKYTSGSRYGSRYENVDTIFIKRMLQTALPFNVRTAITDELYREFVDAPEEVLASEMYLTKDQLNTMKRHGMFIGIHGYEHCWLGEESEKKIQEDIDKALDALDPYIDRDSWVMNYPYGSNSDETVEYIRGKGAVLGLATDVRIADIDSDDLWRLPRLDCNDFPPKSENYLQIKAELPEI